MNVGFVLPSALLRIRAWMCHWAATGNIRMERIGVIEKVQGDNLFPPQHMQRDAVLAHALDHLALLSRGDSGIRAVLAPEWMGISDEAAKTCRVCSVRCF